VAGGGGVASGSASERAGGTCQAKTTSAISGDGVLDLTLLYTRQKWLYGENDLCEGGN